ncbi:MAG: GAF domain-containing protein [candidate division Zixibacteria bacterium]|nr:GAF domain-containing protein [candidate division Zixibacteria bacterium]
MSKTVKKSGRADRQVDSKIETLKTRSVAIDSRIETLEAIPPLMAPDSVQPKLLRTLEAITECNHAVISVTDETELFREICRIIIKVGGHCMTWIGLAENDDRKTVRAVASAGFEDDYLDSVNITWDDTPRGRGPAGTAIRTGQPCIARNILTDPAFAPWRAAAIKRGYASSFSTPLEANDEIIGVLNIYSREADRFDEDEVELLRGLTSSVAYGIAALRARQARETGIVRQELVINILDRLNRPSTEADSIRDVLQMIHDHTGFEAVGIRLEKDDDFPYYETLGFPANFVEAENYLCTRDDDGKIIREPDGNPYLECMCGNILCGRFDPSLPFFSEHGSFWTSSTTQLLASTSKEDRQAHTRNRCNSAGYESVALIPLHTGEKVVGLLQLNDKRKNMLSSELIEFFEGIATSIGIGLARYVAEEALLRKSHDLSKRVKELSCLYNATYLMQFPEVSIERVMQEIVEQFPPSWQYPKIICARITLNEKTYTTTSFKETKWRLTADIYIAEQPVGSLEVFYLEEKLDDFEGSFHLEERNLIDTLASQIGGFVERKQTEEELVQANDMLDSEREALREKNITLKQLLDQIESEKKQIGRQMQSNVNRIILPLLRKLEIGVDKSRVDYVRMVEQNLSEIASPFVSQLETRYAALSPRELEICNMIKNGMSSKDIALTLNTSEGTVRNQRKSIRCKLGIANDSANLQTYLQSI